MAETSSKPSAAWIIGVTSVITVGMTVFNGFNTAQISKVKTTIEQQAQDLEAAKARVERYGFVQKLFPDLLSPDSSKRTLTINLVTLTLTPEEAEKLFVGLQKSNNAEVRAVGNAGAATLVTGNADLVNQLNAGTASERIHAYNQLKASYNSSTEVISQVLAMLDETRIDQLSASGRINTFLFLAGTDPSSWTADQLLQAEDALTRIDKRQKRGKWRMGQRTLEALDQFRKQVRTAQQS